MVSDPNAESVSRRAVVRQRPRENSLTSVEAVGLIVATFYDPHEAHIFAEGWNGAVDHIDGSA